MGQSVPEKRQGKPPQGHIQKPLRHNARGGRLRAKRRSRKASGNCRLRAVRRGEGAVVGPLRPDDGGAGVSGNRLRPVLHRRKRRIPALCGLSRHQHRGFLRGRRFPLQPRRRRPRAHRDNRNLRMGRHGAQRGGCRHANQGDRRIHHVRHEPRHRKRLLRLNGRRQARRAPQAAQRPENRRLQKRLVRARGRPAGLPARRRPAVRKRLLRLLQDGTRLPQAFSELQRRVEQDFGSLVSEYADTLLRRRNPQRRPAHPRRKGALALFQRGRL